MRSQVLTEESLRALLHTGHQSSDDDLVDHTQQNMIRTVYLLIRMLVERQDEYVSSRDLQASMAEHIRSRGIPLLKKFNPVDWFSAEWAKSADGAESQYFEHQYRELFDRIGEDPTSYRINPAWRERVIKILLALGPTPISLVLHKNSAMRVYIANFGLGNCLWPACRSRSSVATFEDEDLRPFWVAGDRIGYIEHCIKTKKTAAGLTPTAPVASRWYNLGHIVASTEGDVWIHREKDDLWWTITRPGGVTVTLEPAFKPAQVGQQIYVSHKPADAWSNRSRKGTPLKWQALHAKAHEFLFTEGTLQQLKPDNAAYALALIAGEDLDVWHATPAWRAKEATAKKGPVTFFDARRRAVVRMVMTARDTVAQANGQQVLRTIKRKEIRFTTPQQFEEYVAALIASQDGLCAITGLELQFDGDHDDPALLCSLDRIDSDGHYEAGNLQVVCKFINRWKSDAKDAEFRRLIQLVCTGGERG